MKDTHANADTNDNADTNEDFEIINNINDNMDNLDINDDNNDNINTPEEFLNYFTIEINSNNITRIETCLKSNLITFINNVKDNIITKLHMRNILKLIKQGIQYATNYSNKLVNLYINTLKYLILRSKYKIEFSNILLNILSQIKIDNCNYNIKTRSLLLLQLNILLEYYCLYNNNNNNDENFNKIINIIILNIEKFNTENFTDNIKSLNNFKYLLSKYPFIFDKIVNITLNEKYDGNN